MVQFAIFPEEFVDHHSTCSGDIEGVLFSEHWNPHVRVAAGRQVRRKSVHLVAEKNADRKPRPPVEQIDGMDGGFDCRNLIPQTADLIELRTPLPGVLPRYRLLRTQGSLAEGLLGRPPGDAAKIEFLNARGIRRPEESPYVVQATDVRQQNRNGQANIFVRRACHRSLEWKSIHGAAKYNIGLSGVFQPAM